MESPNEPYAESIPPTPGAFLAKGLRYTWRSTLLRCPSCGISPIFKPLSQTRSFHDWFTPLDGCPRCGYPYEREPGYFLMAVWGINYGVIALAGLTVGVVVQAIYPQMSPWKLFGLLMLPLPISSILFARHAKAWFLAMDHFFDPHIRDEDADGGRDDRGNQPLDDLPLAGGPSGRKLPDEEAEAAAEREEARELAGAGKR